MKNWNKPCVIICDFKKLKGFIYANAWSVEEAMQLGEFLDNANAGSRGTVYMDFNPGHEIQVEVLGRIILGGYIIIDFITSTGERYTYKRVESGGAWSQY